MKHFKIVIFALLSSTSVTTSANENQIRVIQDLMTDKTSAPIMIIIPAGNFQMGDINDIGQSYEKPVHEVIFDNAFAIGKFPITFEDYDKYLISTQKTLISDHTWGRGKRPVINVNIDDAKSYAKWLSTETGEIYRLPSEAEWEYAARAGSLTRYPWGDEIGNNNAICNGCGSIWDRKKTVPVGEFKPNNWGLHDTQGNIWELTQDCWNYNYVGAPKNGDPWLSGDCSRGVIRGGSFGDTPRDLRSATRLRNYNKTRTVIIGFRLVREIASERIQSIQ